MLLRPREIRSVRAETFLVLPSSELLTKSGLPTISTLRSTVATSKPRPPVVRHTSQLAADGGFGRMPDDEDETSDHQAQDDQEAFEDGFGDDFDDFEAGGEAEDFGDFDDAFEQPSAEPEAPPIAKITHVSSSQYETLLYEARRRSFRSSYLTVLSTIIVR